jgi:hypothetical protein
VSDKMKLLKEVDVWPLCWRQRWAARTLELWNEKKCGKDVTLEQCELEAAEEVRRLRSETR